MIKKLLALLLAVGCLLPLAGCKNQVLMNERLIIRGIGIDLGDDGGYRASIHVMKLSSQEQEVELFTSDGDSVVEALDNVTLQVGRMPLYSQSLMLIIGRSCAEQGLSNILDFFVRYFESRPTVEMFMAEEKAEEILSVRKDGKLILSKNISELAKSGKLNSKVAEARVLDVVNMMQSSAAPFLPIIHSEIDRVYVEGTAIFQGDRLADTLTTDQTRGLLLVTGELQNGAAVLDIPDDPLVKRVSVEIAKTKAEIKPTLKEDKPHFEIKIECKADISEIDGKYTEKLDGKYYEIFEKALAQELQREANSAIQQAIFHNRSDIFYFGQRLMKAETEYWKKNSNHWPTLMQESTFEVTVEAQITRVGQEITPTL